MPVLPDGRQSALILCVLACSFKEGVRVQCRCQLSAKIAWLRPSLSDRVFLTHICSDMQQMSNYICFNQLLLLYILHCQWTKTWKTAECETPHRKVRRDCWLSICWTTQTDVFLLRQQHCGLLMCWWINVYYFHCWCLYSNKYMKSLCHHPYCNYYYWYIFSSHWLHFVILAWLDASVVLISLEGTLHYSCVL